ncbi:hypothetical protein E3P99_04045 [Wallemia hederae]|uniref:Mitochondrial intermembrane space import and assembly protein 40 n=1 Tax=Wallemia hederae TaxID=1540922 RepID=A0A4T0FB51_9BASI|nr:hypothetical protein E3P99_04045 [Wallemia hederae]
MDKIPVPEGSADADANANAQESSESSNSGSSGAYNPETGEINWDCPCLGGMAYGPCGEEFKTAFSCFVNSDADPKGIDCVDAFKGMQDCFRSHPEHYSDEIADDDDENSDEKNEEQKEEKDAGAESSTPQERI